MRLSRTQVFGFHRSIPRSLKTFHFSQTPSFQRLSALVKRIEQVLMGSALYNYYYHHRHRHRHHYCYCPAKGGVEVGDLPSLNLFQLALVRTKPHPPYLITHMLPKPSSAKAVIANQKKWKAGSQLLKHSKKIKKNKKTVERSLRDRNKSITKLKKEAEERSGKSR